MLKSIHQIVLDNGSKYIMAEQGNVEFYVHGSKEAIRFFLDKLEKSYLEKQQLPKRPK